MPSPKSDKVIPLHEGSPPKPAFLFGASYKAPAPDFPISHFAPKASAPAVVQGVDLSGKPKVIFLAGRGKTGKTTCIRWISERALTAGRDLLMGDVDPGNVSFGTYFDGVHEPPDRDSPAVAFRWLEEFVSFAITSRQTAVIDLGGGDTTLRRLADELPDLAAAAEGQGVALVTLYFVGPQIEDLAPVAAMAQREFRPHASAIVMNEGAAEYGARREEAFGPMSRHPLIVQSLGAGGVIPVWMPRLFAADKVELSRLHYLEASTGAVGSDGGARIGLSDMLRVRAWLGAMERQFAGIGTWLP